MIVDCALYRAGLRIPLEGGAHDLAGALEAVRGPEHDFLWVGLHQPSTDELDDAARTFGLHPLAVEDALHAHQRPKLEKYDDGLFLVLKTLWYVDADDAVETGEINLFIGSDYVVSVRHGEGGELHSARLDLEARAQVLGHGPWSVVYAVCDRVVDGYLSVAAALEVDVDEVEASVFSDDRTNDSARIYRLKREIAEFRRAVTPLREPMRRFAEGRVPGMDADAAPFFRDVADHVTRVAETIDNLDSLLSTAFEAHIAQINMRQQDDMRKISAWVALAGVNTLIAGIYGMNFEHMPELEWRLGYPAVLLLMVVTAVALHRLFRRSGWL